MTNIIATLQLLATLHTFNLYVSSKYREVLVLNVYFIIILTFYREKGYQEKDFIDNHYDFFYDIGLRLS